MAEPLPDALSVAEASTLSKVVLARRLLVALRGRLQPLHFLALLQKADPSSYQVALVLPGGAAFVASTPERLFARDGHDVISEAVAGAQQRNKGEVIASSSMCCNQLSTGVMPRALLSAKGHVTRDRSPTLPAAGSEPGLQREFNVLSDESTRSKRVYLRASRGHMHHRAARSHTHRCLQGDLSHFPTEL
jgi:hypothetical protein